MTDDEARDLLNAELSKHLPPGDSMSVRVEQFRDWVPVSPDVAFMADPATLRAMLLVRFWRYIDGRKFTTMQGVNPQIVSDSLALPTIAKSLVRDWEGRRDDAIRSGPPPVTV